jgi:hypothetical protein
MTENEIGSGIDGIDARAGDGTIKSDDLGTLEPSLNGSG